VYYVSNKDWRTSFIHVNESVDKSNCFTRDECYGSFESSMNQKATMSSVRENPVVTLLSNEAKNANGKRNLNAQCIQDVIQVTQNKIASIDIIKKVTAENKQFKAIDHMNGFANLDHV
jgi:hypothetical protein